MEFGLGLDLAMPSGACLYREGGLSGRSCPRDSLILNEWTLQDHAIRRNQVYTTPTRSTQVQLDDYTYSNSLY